jgi:hypothetical protein
VTCYGDPTEGWLRKAEEYINIYEVYPNEGTDTSDQSRRIPPKNSILLLRGLLVLNVLIFLSACQMGYK